MHKTAIIAVLGFLLAASGCADKKVEPEKSPQTKSAEMKVHGGAATKDSDSNGLKEIVKKQTLPMYPAMTIGKAFDEYSHLTKKEWKEVQAANGKIYIDFTGWLQGGSSGIDAIKKGISQQGIEVKFVISQDGAFFIGMVSRLEAKTDGKVSAYPLEDAKAVLDSIYANKNIVF